MIKWRRHNFVSACSVPPSPPADNLILLREDSLKEDKSSRARARATDDETSENYTAWTPESSRTESPPWTSVLSRIVDDGRVWHSTHGQLSVLMNFSRHILRINFPNFPKHQGNVISRVSSESDEKEMFCAKAYIKVTSSAKLILISEDSRFSRLPLQLQRISEISLVEGRSHKCIYAFLFCVKSCL